MDATAKFPVILPSETQAREFDAKLLLACHLAERGHPVIVGSRIEIHNHIHRLPRGLYLAKDVRSSSRRMFRVMSDLGFSIAAWDEEAIVITDPETYHRRRVDADNLNQIKAFCAWGSRDRALIESAPGYRGTPIFETGNPRTDLLTARCRGLFAPEAAALRARFGDFILINSNFGTINHFLRGQAAKRTANGALTNVGAGDPGWWSFRLAVFEGFKAMLPALARAFPDRQIVIRPHPAESHDVWREAAQGFPNVVVIHEGGVHPWIMASAVAVHNGCTTGLESYLLDHPVIAYYPITSEFYDNQLPNAVSTPAHSDAELINILAAHFDGSPLPACAPNARALTEAQVGPLDGGLASARIDDLVAQHGESWLVPLPRRRTRVAGYLHSAMRHASKRINAHRPGHKNSHAYNKHRFPGLTAEQVGERLATLASIMGRFENLRARRIYPDIFVVEK